LQNWKNAVTEETRHFVVKSNCTEAVRKEYANRLEAYYTYFTEDWGISLSPGEVKGKMKFFLYRDYEDFLKQSGASWGVGGFFDFVNKELQLYDDQADQQLTRGVLFHEGNHLLTYLIDTSFRYPIWLNEGMAEYYGSTQIDEKGKFHVGGLQYERIVSLRTDKTNGKFMKLREVLTAEQPQFRARHYAVAWSFVNFMMESPKYGKQFRGFFANLAKNPDLKIEIKTYSNLKGSLKEAPLPNIIEALEKRFGKSLEQLEAEWLQYIDQAYGELSPEAWYLAARLALANPQDDGSHVKTAFDCYAKAVAGGIRNADCFRQYAEMLRKGGVKERGSKVKVEEPDQERAWEMIQKAIDLDPIEPYSYMEAAGILIIDGKLLDLDRAMSMIDIAMALGGTRNSVLKGLRDDLLAQIEPAREKSRVRAEAEAAAAASDPRQWHVAFFYVDGQKPPPNLVNLKTTDLSALIRSGKVKAADHVFQSWKYENEETHVLEPGPNPWDKDWVDLRDVPLFADDLAAAAGAPVPAAGSAPAPAPADAGAGAGAGADAGADTSQDGAGSRGAAAGSPPS
ncbi:MAG TPA: DUF1570 domain-containing protein, partial [Planctomycetota bacterium]|nr:DUF1570 domain-containing protein [Planctomycetota bacterium]